MRAASTRSFVPRGRSADHGLQIRVVASQLLGRDEEEEEMERRGSEASSRASRNGCAVGCCALLLACGWGCSDGGAAPDQGDGSYRGMAGAVAECEFSLLTLRLAEGPLQEVDINGLPVEEMHGGEKNGLAVDVVRRRGVRLSAIFARAGLSADEQTPVNGIGRDGYDPLRTRLGGDTSQLPDFGFVRDEGYVYLGGGGEKDVLHYPEMEGRSLMIDYDLASDAEVPAELGGMLSSIGQYRWKMMEKLGDQERGVLEIDPVVAPSGP